MLTDGVVSKATTKRGAARIDDSLAGTISLKRLQDGQIELEIVGLTPYLPHKWSKKSIGMMPGHPDKERLQEGNKGARKPEEEASDCVYALPDGRPGIPAVSLKAAMVGGCRFFSGLTMIEAKLKFHVIGEGPLADLVPFTYKEKILREDTPRNSGGTSDLRYRYMFTDWKAKVKVAYIVSCIDEKSIVALLDAAGRGGIGDWRPSAPKSATGTFGTFRVVTED